MKRDLGLRDIWNIWFTLMTISALLGILALILEAMGVFKDIGLILSGIGLFLTVWFGITASTRTAVTRIHADIMHNTETLQALGEDLRQIFRGVGETLNSMSEILRRIENKLP